MDWIRRLDHGQRLWVLFSIIGLVAMGAVVITTYPQANPALARQLISTECKPVRALPANEISPHAMPKERYALYLQCEELFWYRARYPGSDLTLAEYQDRLTKERTTLLTRAFVLWFLGVLALYVLVVVSARTFRWVRRRSETRGSSE